MQPLNYSSLIQQQIDHLKTNYDSLSAGGVPEFWFVTMTFVAAKNDMAEVTSISPDRCFALHEQLYTRLLSRLMNNYERKRHLQPLTYVYYDLPCSKREKSFATLSGYERWKANRTRDEHPELDTHLHCVMLIPPVLAQRFNEIAPTLEPMFQALGPANRSLHAARLHSSDELRNVMFYSSKLLNQPQSVLKPLSKFEAGSDQSRVACIDLYTVLPSSKREPRHTKQAYEMELLEAHDFARRHIRGRLETDLESGQGKGSRLIPRSQIIVHEILH